MKKSATILAVMMMISTGCNSSLFVDPTNTSTFTPTIDQAATDSAIAAGETQAALEAQQTEEAESIIMSETASARRTATRSADQTSIAAFQTEMAKPTDTPVATATTASSGGSARFTNCQDSTGGRTKVRVENTTGGTAYMTLIGPETRHCAIPAGIVQIFIKGGVYSVTSNMCGQSYNFGSHVINSTWKLILKCDY